MEHITGPPSSWSDPRLQAGAATALLAAAAYALSFAASAWLSRRLPPLRKAYARLQPCERADWNSRAPSTLHALAITGLCAWLLCASGEFSSSSSGSLAAAAAAAAAVPPALRAPRASYAVLGVSAGYFVADAALLLLVPAVCTAAMAAHHAVALLSLAVAARAGQLHLYVLLLLLTEATTPFVNLRFWLDKLGARASERGAALYAANGLALLAVWFAARVASVVPFYLHVAASWPAISGNRGGGGAAGGTAGAAAAAGGGAGTGAVVPTPPAHAVAMLLGVPLLLFGLNAVWFVKIFRGALKLVVGMRQQGGNMNDQASAATAAAAAAAAAAAPAGKAVAAAADAAAAAEADTGKELQRQQRQQHAAGSVVEIRAWAAGAADESPPRSPRRDASPPLLRKPPPLPPADQPARQPAGAEGAHNTHPHAD